MPISPENAARYPKNWREISDRIKRRAGNRCEGIPGQPACGAGQSERHPITGSIVVLTVAHMDHQPENCADENLRALCQRCHNRYDRTHRQPQCRADETPQEAERRAVHMTLELTIPRRLESPNTWNGKHWRTKHRITQLWEREIAIQALQAVPTLKDWMVRPVPTERMRVDIERHVPSRRNFIRDDDNLEFACKPLLDALKRQHLIRNDSRQWLVRPTPTQHVSADGKDYTVIRIRPVSV